MKNCLILRGHIRKAFGDGKLYQYVKELISLYDIDIYIHTWNILQSNVSWRNNFKLVYEIKKNEIIRYFGVLSHKIKFIIIDDDTKIDLIGNIDGNVCDSHMPLMGWKNMWFGKFSIIDYIKNLDIKYDMVINTRFDLFSAYNSVDQELSIIKINQFIENNNDILFLYDKAVDGIDNFYIGKFDVIYNMTFDFNHNLDEILSKYPQVKHQEYLVFYYIYT